MVVGVIGWFMLGLSTGLIASKLVNKGGRGARGNRGSRADYGHRGGVFMTGAAVQVYMLAHAVPVEN